MKEYNADLQLHGIYAGGVSKNMLIPVMAEQSRLKGIDVLVTADVLHAKWMEHLKQNIVETENNVFMDKAEKTFFIVGGEVEDNNRVHHLIYLPDFNAAGQLREKLKGFGILDCVMCGRPKLRLSAESIAEKVDEAGGIVGPAHSFTPYMGLYAHWSSVQEAYGAMAGKIHFIELGLSADSYFADLIEENHKYSFLTSSDAHSPWPNRMGREFNRIKMNKPTFGNLVIALKEREEKMITLNAGLDPREGKYHKTACNACFAKYSIEQAERFKWKCVRCKGEIKKGVKDRILELATFSNETHPSFRPNYLHLLPLAEIIQIAFDVKQVNSQKVQSRWRDIVGRFGNEISVLVDTPIVEIAEVDKAISGKIEAFRNGFVLYDAGGGGKYGTPFICDNEREFEMKKAEMENSEMENEIRNQKTLKEY